ncbi:hypothetical protein IBL26_08320 [Roseomonas aerophila]|uniref:Uncharacterized protein n=1 Tax=Teichococcus aerophilus TaxID=1224513 RepID=A0ABR7RK89_9PROT|nr:hypothetical protein [Pseudoroseomonas aerophila]MBC9206838.1 hypothetical protein [Pseudoroseomonas aerophila]
MNRRSCLALLALPLLAACADDPAGGFLGGAGDPVRGAALNAPFNFGNLGALRGQPGRVALALVQLEFLADQLPQDPYWQNRINPLTIQQLQRARNDTRQALGIPADAPAGLVMDSLRQANAALEGLNPAGARAALSGPAFPLGGQAVLERLTNLPDLPSATTAAGAVNRDVMALGNRR